MYSINNFYKRISDISSKSTWCPICTNKTELKLYSILYLITTKNKAKENIFKFGSTINEKSRISSYNTGNVEAEKFFYVATYNCYDAITLEKRIAKLLVNFKIPKDMDAKLLTLAQCEAIIADEANKPKTVKKKKK